jgi:hypothetical protein
VHAFSFSFAGDSSSPGPASLGDWHVDWLGVNWPYPVFVAAAGNAGGTVENRFYNGLVVGGSTDNFAGTWTKADDTVATWAGWQNFDTPISNDYELPNLIAPACCVSAAGAICPGCGTSGSTPQVAGTAALVIARDPATFTNWPEMTRAVLMATATSRLDAGTLTHLGGVPDQRAGAGVLSASLAVALAAPATYDATGPRGRFSAWVSFADDFDPVTHWWNRQFHTGTGLNGRLRAVIAWDATPAGCDPVYGDHCEGSTRDADLDLTILDDNTGAYTSSWAFASSWEMVDIPVDVSHSYTIRVTMGYPVSWGTYIGVAWYTYSP